MKFFAPENEQTAAGLFSGGHLLMFIICVFVLIVALYLLFKKKNSHPLTYLKVISLIMLGMEISKIIWGIKIGRYGGWYDFLPLWFCSLFIPLSLFAAFTKGKIQHMSLTFLFYGGVVGGIAYLFFPTTSIGRYPIFHFISIHSMFYHTILIFSGIFVVKEKLITPSIKDFRDYLLITTIFCVISYIGNRFFGTNYMFLSGYSNNPVLKILYNNTGIFYPIIISIGQNFGTFFIGYGGYKLLTSHRK